MESSINLLNYFESIIDILEEQDFLVHNFLLNDSSTLYSVQDYVSGKLINNISYTLVIDTNILHFLLRAIEGHNNKKTRGAIALVVFCQIAEVDIEPY